MRGILVGLVLALAVVACMSTHKTDSQPLWAQRMEKMQLLNGMWLQIREMRAEAGMELDPPRPLELQYRGKTVNQTRSACPEVQRTAPTCTDSCTLADQICDNAEGICKIADELGKDDPAQEKCTSAKASCREAKQRCCDCNANPPAPAAGAL